MAAAMLRSVDDAVGLLRPGMTVYLPGLSGESLGFYEALRRNAGAAAGVRFVGAHFPGINQSNYVGLHPQARLRAYFMRPEIREAVKQGRAELVPTDYPGIARDLASLEIDLALAQVTPADAQGRCSTGLSCDFLPAVWARAKRRVVHINPQLPRTRGSFAIDFGDVDAFFELDAPLVTYRTGRVDDAQRAHAAKVCALVDDGDVLQFGVGKVQAAILEALTGHRRLRIYSGMISSPVRALLDAGALDPSVACDVGLALGDMEFYRLLDGHPQFYFRPATETHSVLRIGAIANFRAINSAIEVDLFGQVTSDLVDGALLAGVGGLPAFVNGAQVAPNGRSIIVLPAATPDGGISRIVPTLGAPGLPSLSRHNADYFVTEHGVAAVRGLTLAQRAEALIAIADPRFREPLSAAWHGIYQKL